MTHDGLLSASFRISSNLLVTAEHGGIFINEPGHTILINPPEVDSLIRALQECKRFLSPKEAMEESKGQDGELLPSFHFETDWGNLIGRQVELANGEVWTIKAYNHHAYDSFPLTLTKQGQECLYRRDGSSYLCRPKRRIVKVLALAK